MYAEEENMADQKQNKAHNQRKSKYQTTSSTLFTFSQPNVKQTLQSEEVTDFLAGGRKVIDNVPPCLVVFHKPAVRETT